MNRDDWMLLSLTFLTGLAIGMYVYIAVFKPVYAPENLNTSESEAGDWSIVGKRRGGEDDPRYVHPSFRLLANGEYIYLPGGLGGNSLEPRKGSVSRKDLSLASLSMSELTNYSREISATSCSSDRAGYDYEYRVTMEGETFVLDTCYSVFAGSATADDFELLWNRFSGASRGRSYTSFADWIEDFIRQHLGFDSDESN